MYILGGGVFLRKLPWGRVLSLRLSRDLTIEVSRRTIAGHVVAVLSQSAKATPECPVWLVSQKPYYLVRTGVSRRVSQGFY